MSPTLCHGQHAPDDRRSVARGGRDPSPCVPHHRRRRPGLGLLVPDGPGRSSGGPVSRVVGFPSTPSAVPGWPEATGRVDGLGTGDPAHRLPAAGPSGRPAAVHNGESDNGADHRRRPAGHGSAGRRGRERAPAWGRCGDPHTGVVAHTGGVPGPGRTAHPAGDRHRRRLSCCDVQERVYLNESPLDEPYIAENVPLDLLDEGCRPRRFAPVAVALGELFVMGDHRATAKDSRCLGTVPVSAVVAVVEAPNPG